MALAANEGGYEPTTWYPAATFFLGLLLVTALTLGRGGRLALDLPGRIAVGLFAAFVAWTFGSILWADAPGDAWEGANRALLYLLVFTLFRALPWSGATGGAFLAAHAVAMAFLAVFTVAGLAGSSDPLLGLIGGRLAEPTGYHNATAALFLASMFPALLLAPRRELPVPVRGLLLAAAGVLLEVSVLPQSRGSVIALPLVFVAAIAISPNRARLLLAIAPVVLATVLASGVLLDVYSTVRDGGDVGAAFEDALQAILLSAGVLFVVGCLVAIAERKSDPSERARRAMGRAVGAASLAGAVAAVIVALGVIGNPVTWVGDRWDDFASGQDTSFEQDSRLTGSLGSNRTDFWRVALQSWSEQPILGLGMDQFEVEYARERRSSEEPSNPHSVAVKVLSQTGVVGTLFFGGFLVVCVLSAIGARVASGATLDGAVAAGGTLAFAYWFVHGLGDWFWELPGLAAPAMAALAIAGAVGAREGRAGAATDRPGAGRVGLAALLLLALVPLASLLGPWAAARDVGIAAKDWPQDPAAAFDRLERARSLNPLSDEPDVIAGTIAMRMGDDDRIRSSFNDALERAGGNWYPRLILGALDAIDGNRAAALAELRRAQRLAPGDPLINRVLRRARSGDPVELRVIDRSLRNRICSRLGRTEATKHCE